MDFQISILQLRDILIVPIQMELHDNAARKLQIEILNRIEKTNATFARIYRESIERRKGIIVYRKP